MATTETREQGPPNPTVKAHAVQATKDADAQDYRFEQMTIAHAVIDNSFRPESLTLEKATSMGYPTEKTLDESPSPSSWPEDLEKGIVAPILVQQQLEAVNYETSDATPVKRKTSTTSVSSGSKWRSSRLPDEMSKLPSKRAHWVSRRLRHKLLAVYQRLFSVVFIGNMIALIIEMVLYRNARPFGPPLGNIATATSANITAAILIRQEYVINALYDIFCWTPVWVPLRVRRIIAKLYQFGGVHSGCAVSATTWFILYTALITKQYVDGDFRDTTVLVISCILLSLLVTICLFAIPKFRIVSHNTFEAIHRFAGWIAVALFWVEILLVSRSVSREPGADSLGAVVIQNPSFWFLLIISFCIILPWLRLRKVEAFPEVLSQHATRIHFKSTKTNRPIIGIRITDNPLKEWHAFATVPVADGSSFSLIVSDNGDWTRKQILEPATSYWVRGIPITGVLRMAEVFRRIVLVGTGSGIGPCLSMLLTHHVPCRLLWSTPNPLQTYGKEIMSAVMSADPNSMIIDTRTSGRPDMVALAYHLYLETKAEAVFVISNPYLTRRIVYGMESRGIPAYGPIWDS